jgi:hypothetical protein
MERCRQYHTSQLLQQEALSLSGLGCHPDGCFVKKPAPKLKVCYYFIVALMCLGTQSDSVF